MQYLFALYVCQKQEYVVARIPFTYRIRGRARFTEEALEPRSSVEVRRPHSWIERTTLRVAFASGLSEEVRFCIWPAKSQVSPFVHLGWDVMRVAGTLLERLLSIPVNFFMFAIALNTDAKLGWRFVGSDCGPRSYWAVCELAGRNKPA